MQLSAQQEFFSKAKEILSEVDNIKFNSPSNALPYILNVSIDGYKSEPMLNALATENIYVSKGSACAKGHRSYVLSEIGLSNDRIDSAIRISFSRDNTLEEIETLKNAIIKITEKMRRFKK